MVVPLDDRVAGIGDALRRITEIVSQIPNDDGGAAWHDFLAAFTASEGAALCALAGHSVLYNWEITAEPGADGATVNRYPLPSFVGPCKLKSLGPAAITANLLHMDGGAGIVIPAYDPKYPS
jgi:hypothetical protein